MPMILRAMWGEDSMAPAFKRWLVLSYGMAFFAIVPGLLRFCGVPAPLYQGWWMNVFLFHPAIDRIETGGMLVGGFGITLCFGFQYGLLLCALAKTKDRPRS